MDLFDVVCTSLVLFCVSGVLALVAFATVDGMTNGFDDCIDSPEYCKTVKEYKQYWPDYQVPLESIK